MSERKRMCRKCGFELENGFAYCPKCGAKYEEAPKSYTPQAAHTGIAQCTVGKPDINYYFTDGNAPLYVPDTSDAEKYSRAAEIFFRNTPDEDAPIETKALALAAFAAMLNSVKNREKADFSLTSELSSGDAPKKVIKYLYRHFGNDRRLRIYLCPLYRNEKMPSRESMRRILRFEQELFRLGYEDEGLYYIFRPRRLRCFACSPGGHTIAPDGRIFNCSHVMDAKHCAGTVSCFDECSPQRLSYTKAPLSDECIACIFLPVCGGGCRSGELGTADVFQCFQYRSVIPEIMKLRLKNLK